MQLRPYQAACLEAIRESLRNNVARPLACLPTGSGKSPVIAHLLHTLSEKYPDERFMCCVHTQELVSQLAQTFETVARKKAAIYSASLHRRDKGPVIFGQIQSVFRKACDFGRVKLLIIDECDHTPPKGEGQYRTFINELLVINPDLRIVGFTATPYRTGTGLVYGDGQPFNELVFDAPIKDLINDGWLSPLRSKDGGAPELSGVHVRQGEYVAAELELVMSDESLVEKAADELLRYGRDRRAWLVFCSGVKHAALVSAALTKRGVEAPVIEGNTNEKDRSSLISRYRDKNLRCLVNVNVLSIGFDAPHVDLIALLRPTKSPGLYYQQIGRGLRKAGGKENCLVLDLAGNIAEHGPIDSLNERIRTAKSAKAKQGAPVKTCEGCQAIVPAGCRICPECQKPFPEIAIAKHDAYAADDSPLTDMTIRTADVSNVSYRVHTPKDGLKPPSIRVDYRCGLSVYSEWWSVDAKAHPYARTKALMAIAETPKREIESRTLQVGREMIGTYQGQQETLLTALAVVPYLSCLLPPRQIQLQTDPKNPKYQKIVRRLFAEDVHAT